MWHWLWKHKWKLSLVYFGFWAAVFPFAIDYMVRTQFLPPVLANVKHLEPHYPAILADFKLLEANPIFKETARVKNAEPYLSDSVSWEGLQSSPAVRAASEKLHAIDEQFPRWRVDSKQMLKLYQSAQLNNTDTDWVEGLLEFDHWDLTTRREVAEKLQKAGQSSGLEKIGILAGLAIPNYMDFRASVYLHYLKMVKRGQGQEGIRLIRHAANLAQSSNSLVGQMIAVAFLKDEAGLASAFGVPWTPLSNEQIEAYKRVSWAWPGLVRTVWAGEFPAQFVPYLRPEMGMCGGAFEAAVGAGGMQDFLEPRFWFETDFSKELARVRDFEVKTQALCKMQAFAPFRSRTPASANGWTIDSGKIFGASLEDGANQTQQPNYARIPYVRRMVALILLGLSNPQYGRLYEEEKN